VTKDQEYYSDRHRPEVIKANGEAEAQKLLAKAEMLKAKSQLEPVAQRISSVMEVLPELASSIIAMVFAGVIGSLLILGLASAIYPAFGDWLMFFIHSVLR
jgi:hypothetical protein